MRRCWSESPPERPAFNEIEAMLEELLQSMPATRELEVRRACSMTVRMRYIHDRI